jgi:TctA family transporter
MEALFGHMLGAAGALASPTIVLIMLAGVVIGIILGAMPGFGSSQALALLFPLTFAMTVDQAILFFLAVLPAVEYGSSIPAILIRTPGTGASAVTVLDGYAMTRNGLARKALRISLYSGVIGGVASTLIFIVAGSYAYANYTAHVVMVLVFAAIAHLFEKMDIPVVPLVLAFIMGPIIEINLNRALTITAGDLSAVLLRPITAAILLLALATAV